MSEPLASQVATLIDAFKAQGWKELRVETDTIYLILSEDASADIRVVAQDGATAADTSVPAQERSSAPQSAAPPAKTRDPSWSSIVAPNLGTFYRSPKPGSPPFVEEGDLVAPETEICLLEVMKLFTSVTAGVAGVIREIVAQDAELVEGGQPLFYVEPQGN